MIHSVVIGEPSFSAPEPPGEYSDGLYRPAPRAHRPAPLRPGSAASPGYRERPQRRAAPRRPGRTDSSTGAFRSDIEGLRAVAVLLVLLYHAELGPFHGGLVGVDVFFVLSGFLITSLLLREVESTGTVSLPNFWARRARRLLPASALVILATVVAARSMLSPVQLRSLGHDAIAAAGFVINVVFAGRENDYLGAQMADALPSPLLHFWSLALEEQFYVIWPLVILALARTRAFMRSAALAVGALGLASLLACIYFTETAPVWTFYLLPTRAWELLAGAALAIAGNRILALREDIRVLLGWAGILGIVIASLVISDNTTFPGFAALLPVLSTVAVLTAGGSITRYGPVMLLRARPLQWMGKHSYAIYLWHWPALILADAKWGPLSAAQRLGAILLAVALSAVSFAIIENPVRHAHWLSTSARRSLGAGAALVALGLGAGMVTTRTDVSAGSGAEVAAPDLNVDVTDPPGTPTSDSANPTETTSPVSTPPTDAGSQEPERYDLAELTARNAKIVEDSLRLESVPSNLTPNFSDIDDDLPKLYSDGCLLRPGQVKAGECIYGDPNGSVRVALIGDSHAAQWFPAVEKAAIRRGWRLLILTKQGCPLAEFVTYDEANRKRTECAPWRNDVYRRLEAEKPDLVYVAMYRYRLTNRPAKSDARQVWERALTPVMKKLRPLTDELVFLADIAHPESWPATCLSRNRSNPSKCIITRKQGERPPLVAAELAVVNATDSNYARVTDWMCNKTQCAVMLGNIQMYRDDNHIGATTAQYFAPFIEAIGVSLLKS
ncbi:MAG: hypothetical protein RL219_2062 [Actinomycetota bacterium]|jgi:peptidoglycan/LPS O-acetylase OafA/YrhL